MASGVDVTVVGGGIFGLSCAWAMAERGARVRVIERRVIGAGASGGVVGALAPHVPEQWTPVKAFQFDALIAAEGFWQGVAGAGGQDPGYARLGRRQPVANEAAYRRALDRGREAERLWQGKAVWRVERADTLDGWVPASPSDWIIEDTLSARVNPAAACTALVAALRSRGADVAEGVVPAADISGPVLWATGAAGLDDLSAAFGEEIGRGIKGQAAVLALDRRDAAQIYADGLHIVPHADGTVAIGSTSEREFASPDTTDAQLDDVLARARRAVPAIALAPVMRRWAGVRPRAKNRAPLLGPWPGRPGHFIANGGFKIGFGMAPGVASVMADLILEGHDTIPEAFRFTDPAAAKPPRHPA